MAFRLSDCQEPGMAAKLAVETAPGVPAGHPR